MYPDAAFIILGDFNHCNLRRTMPKLYQFVTFPTRGNNTLDRCYNNIRKAYSAEPEPHLGKSDHLAILLKPAYIKRLKSKPVTVKTVNTWTDSALADLQGCLEATDMNIFKLATDNIHEYTDTVRDYVRWCTSNHVPSREVRVFPNEKPWFNTDICRKIKKRSEAFKSGDGEEYQRARYELRKSIKAAKRAPTNLRASTLTTTHVVCGREFKRSQTRGKSQPAWRPGTAPSRPPQHLLCQV